MKLSTLKNKQGEMLLPEKKDTFREDFKQCIGYNQCLYTLADKDIRDYVRIDIEALHDLLLEQFDDDINDILRENVIQVILYSKDILKTGGTT